MRTTIDLIPQKKKEKKIFVSSDMMNRKYNKIERRIDILSLSLSLSLISITFNANRNSGFRAIEITAYNGTSFGYNRGQE